MGRPLGRSNNALTCAVTSEILCIVSVTCWADACKRKHTPSSGTICPTHVMCYHIVIETMLFVSINVFTGGELCHSILEEMLV